MVNYDFVEFLNEDISSKVPDSHAEAGRNIPATATKKDPVELARAILVKFEGKIAFMHGEAEELEIAADADFNRAVEMRGQGKTLAKQIVEAAEQFSKPLWKKYKEIKNLETSITAPLAETDKLLKKKTDDFAYIKLLAQRKAEQKAREEAAKLQAKIDAEQRAQAAAERAAAKKEKRAAVIPEPIVVDVPVVPQAVAAKTEHGSVSLKMVLKGEITDLESDFVFKMVLAELRVAYRTLAETALKKAIKAGAVGIKGGPGVTVREVAETQHRRR
jgi:hypothetical protein